MFDGQLARGEVVDVAIAASRESLSQCLEGPEVSFVQAKDGEEVDPEALRLRLLAVLALPALRELHSSSPQFNFGDCRSIFYWRHLLILFTSCDGNLCLPNGHFELFHFMDHPLHRLFGNEWGVVQPGVH